MSQEERLALRTRALHVGEEPDPVTGAVDPPLVLSTNFIADPEAISFSAVDMKDDDPYCYARWSTPNVRCLERKLADLEDGEDALCLATGVGAASALLLGVLKQGDHLLLSDVCYAGIAELARTILPGFGIAVTTVNFADLDAVRAAIRPETRLVWAETPCNPILRLTDIAAMAELAHAAGARLVVDSTMATPLATLPLALGADYVVHSLTKYLNGHGDALGGAIVGGKQEMARLRQLSLVHYGGALSPFNAWLIRRGLHTFALRMWAHEEGAKRVAEFLESHGAVKRVIYPGLDSHPQHALARRQMRNFSGMLTFQVKGDGQQASRQLFRKLRVFQYAVSLGKQRSLVFYLATADMLRTSFELSAEGERSYREFAGEGIFRVSVGLEDPEDLCRDLEQALTGL